MPMQRKHDPKLDRLAEIALFRSCTRRELQELATLTTEIDVARGAVLCREGYTGTECFVASCDGCRVCGIQHTDQRERRLLGPYGEWINRRRATN